MSLHDTMLIRLERSSRVIQRIAHISHQVANTVDSLQCDQAISTRQVIWAV